MKFDRLSLIHTSCRSQQLSQRATMVVSRILRKVSNYLQCSCPLQVAADSQCSVKQP